jgi:phosphoheptose isomerase
MKGDTLKTLGSLLEDGLERHLSAVGLLRGETLGLLERLAVEVHDTLAAGGKILACGNGGSASDAQHLVAELVGRYLEERRALPGVALASDPSVVTCLANDYGYDRVFARQVEALGRPGDMLVAITTSGRSPNVLEALRVAGRLGLRKVALLGGDGGPALPLADLALVVRCKETARIQECHIILIHLLCEAVDRLLAERREA